MTKQVLKIDRAKVFNPIEFIGKDWSTVEEDERSLALSEVCLSSVRFDRGFCGVGKHSHKKAAILVTYTGGSNLSCAYVSEGADLMSKIVLGIGIFRDFSIETSSGVGSLR